MTAVPSFAFLNAIQFTGFLRGAVRLLSGEIVPAEYSTWNGGSLVNDNLEHGKNWWVGCRRSIFQRPMV